MSRRRAAVKRQVMPDAKYSDVLLTKLINKIMLGGKKTIATDIVYGAMQSVVANQDKSVVDAFKIAIGNVKPAVEVKSRRVGGATYQVPVPVSEHRSETLAIRWIVGFARKRAGQDMTKRLSIELGDAFHNRGSAVKKREDTHKMAAANQAFSHYRW
jgi:small subunit ribosomal protein S7